VEQLFGNVLRRRRTAVGISQEDLAGKANLDRTYISMLERGKRMPSIEVVRKLAQALGTTMVSLIGDLEAELQAQETPVADAPADGPPEG
jgi:transcriptional regulator with XRE-family HTH domain